MSEPIAARLLNGKLHDMRVALLSAGAAFAAGAVLSVGAALWQQRFNDRLIHERLSVAATIMAERMSQRMAIYQYGLRGLRGMIITVGPEALQVSDLERYGKTRNLATEFPGTRGIGFIRRIPASRSADFSRVMRESGMPDAAIKEMAPHAGDHFVIQYVEPLQGNRAVIGLDIGSEYHRRQAALIAMDTGIARLTAPITLVQESGKPQQSFLLLLPVYDAAVTPTTVTQRRRSLVGWTYAPLVTDEVLHTLPLDADQISLSVVDITEPKHGMVIVATRPVDDVHPYRYSRNIEVYGRRWRMLFGARAAFVAAQGVIAPRWVLLGGLAVSALVSALCGSVVANTWRRRQAAAVQAQLAAIVENSNDAILGNTLAGVVTTWNRGAEALFGYMASEAVGKTVAELIVPPDLRTEEADILARLARGEIVPHFDTTRLRRDGSLVSVAVTASPIRDAAGAIVGASKTVRDISERKALEALAERTYTEMADAVSNRTAQLRRLNILLDSVLGSLELMIIATDEAGVITVFNRGAEHVLGYGASDMVNRTALAMLVRKEDIATRLGAAPETLDRHAGMREVLRAACARGPETSEWTYVRRNGEQIPVSVAISPLYDGQAVTGYLTIAMDASQLHLAQTELQRQHAELLIARDHLLLAADVARLGVWSWHLDGRRPEWNAHMFSIYGVPMGADGAAPTIDEWFGLIHPEDLASAKGTLDAVTAGHGDHDQLLRIVRPDGQVRYLQAAARTEYDSTGAARRITGISLDVTERMELVNTLQRAKEQADAASSAKSNFLANMSHEIRTPLNAVLGMLQILQHSGLSTEQLDYATKAAGAARSLLQLLNDLLDYSKIEAGKLVLDIHPFDMGELLGDLANVLAGTQGAKEIEVMFDIDPTLPSRLLGDRLRLQQVLINLAGNALKFTERGAVVLSVHRLADTHRQTIRFAVTDTGIGIARDQQETIFESFTQAEASISRRFGGTGLGLVICRRLVGLMGAKLCLESELGRGSRFWFDVELPVANGGDKTLICVPPVPAMHVLVVDDNPLALAILVRMVDSIGWRVRSVSSGTDAIEAVCAAVREGDPFDVVLMDWSMPDMNGVDAARGIAGLTDIDRPPVIIMVTAYGREALASMWDDTGPVAVADLLTKPIMPQLVVDSVVRALQLGPAPSPPAEQARRLTGTRILVAEDNVLNQEVVAVLLTREGASVTLAGNGREAVSLATGSDFDVILMDMQMPEVDGLEATRCLRAIKDLSELPVIAMTANASIADRERCLAAGMNGHIAKPIDIEEVVSVLLEALGKGRLPVAGRNVEPVAAIMRRFGGAFDIYARLLAGLPEQAEELLAAAEASLAVKDFDGTLASLHTLKGTASTLGASGIAAYIAQLERSLRDAPDATSADTITALRTELDIAMKALQLQLADASTNANSSGQGAGGPLA